MTPGAKSYRARTRPATRTVATNLDIAPGEPTHYIERIRTADGIPMALERTNLATARFPTLLDVLGRDDSLYDILGRAFGVRLESARQTVTIARLTATEAKRLEVAEDRPGVPDRAHLRRQHGQGRGVRAVALPRGSLRHPDARQPTAAGRLTRIREVWLADPGEVVLLDLGRRQRAVIDRRLVEVALQPLGRVVSAATELDAGRAAARGHRRRDTVVRDAVEYTVSRDPSNTAATWCHLFGVSWVRPVTTPCPLPGAPSDHACRTPLLALNAYPLCAGPV